MAAASPLVVVVVVVVVAAAVCRVGWSRHRDEVGLGGRLEGRARGAGSSRPASALELDEAWLPFPARNVA